MAQHIITVPCKGRDAAGQEVLAEPVLAEVSVSHRTGSSIISLDVRCPHNTGSHGQRCKASHPGKDKVGDGVACCYACDLPYALENKSSKR